MTVAIIGAPVVDSAGWNPTLTITGSSNALVFFAEGGNAGTPVFTSISSDQDGAADWKALISIGGSVFGIAVWYNASTAIHDISVVESDIDEEKSALYEVSGLDSGETGVEDSATATSGIGSAHATGSVSPAADAFLAAWSRMSASYGGGTPATGWTEGSSGSAEYNQYRAYTGGTENADWTSGGSLASSESCIIAIKGASGGLNTDVLVPTGPLR